jgi:hypothetical protein
MTEDEAQTRKFIEGLKSPNIKFKPTPQVRES